MSYARLILDRHDPETAHQLLLYVIPFVIECGAAEGEYRRGRVYDFVVFESLNESLVAGFLYQLGDASHRSLERPHFPIGGSRRSVQYFRRPVWIYVKLEDCRAFGTKCSLAIRAARVAFYIDDLTGDGPYQSGAAH